MTNPSPPSENKKKLLGDRLWAYRYELGMGMGDSVLGDIAVWLDENPEVGLSLIEHLEGGLGDE